MITLVPAEDRRGKYTTEIALTFTVQDTPDYSNSDQLGSLITVSNAVRKTGGTGKIRSLVLYDDDKLNADFDVLIFDSSPTIASSDNGALDISEANLQKLIGRIEIRQADWSDISGHTYCVIGNLDLPVKSLTKDLYFLLQARATLNFADTGALTGRVVIEQD